MSRGGFVLGGYCPGGYCPGDIVRGGYCSDTRKIIAKSQTKSCSLDPAPSWMVKDSVHELIPMVTILVNLSLQSANVPDSMKQALVTLLLLFLIYIIPLAQLIRSYGLNNHGYADDTQLCLSFKKTSDNAIVRREILNLEKCLCDISVWMSQNKLKLNNDKNEIILFGSKKHLAELNIKSTLLSVAGTDVSVASEPVRNL